MNNVVREGFLVLNKRTNISSFKELEKVAKLTPKKSKVGHTGTLDPLCTGVLVLLFGNSTKLAQIIVSQRKSYRTTIKLGEKTDSYDSDGKIIDTKPFAHIDDLQIKESIMKFRGNILQKPPIFSAIHKDGKRLYELARQGKTVEIEPRKIEIYSLNLEKIEKPFVSFSVDCSKGTYIRSLAYDIGEDLGCGSHIVALERTSVGDFSIEKSVKFEQLNPSNLPSFVNKIDDAFLQLYERLLKDFEIRSLRVVKISEMISDFNYFYCNNNNNNNNDFNKNNVNNNVNKEENLNNNNNNKSNNENEKKEFTINDIVEMMQKEKKDLNDAQFYRIYLKDDKKFIGLAYQLPNRFLKLFYVSAYSPFHRSSDEN